MDSGALKAWTPDVRVNTRQLQAVSADEAMQDGMNARWGGMGKNDCPYPHGSLQADRWMIGWLKEDSRA